jgi:hypothetical protein
LRPGAPDLIDALAGQEPAGTQKAAEAILEISTGSGYTNLQRSRGRAGGAFAARPFVRTSTARSMNVTGNKKGTSRTAH